MLQIFISNTLNICHKLKFCTLVNVADIIISAKKVVFIGADNYIGYINRYDFLKKFTSPIKCFG